MDNLVLSEVIIINQTIIKVTDNGPYQVAGTFKIVDQNGDSFTKEGDVSLCRCGYSDNKPFCDGTHEEIQFKSEPHVNKLMVEV